MKTAVFRLAFLLLLSLVPAENLRAQTIVPIGPKLTAEQIRTGVRISWPTNAADFVLQSASILPAGWLDLPIDPQIAGTEFFVMVPIGNGNQFFRLINFAAPATLPVLTIAPDGGLSDGQFLQLAGDFGLEGASKDPRGLIFFIDPARFQNLPRMPMTDDATIKRLQADTEEGTAAATLFEAFDLEKLKTIKPLDPEIALQRTLDSFRKSNLLPPQAQPNVTHTRLSIMDAKGLPTMEDVLLDTHVSFDLFANGFPLVGPGAKINITFDGDGKVSQLLFSHPKMDKGKEVAVIPEATALTRATQFFPRTAQFTKPRLVYFCPSLLLGQPKAILPYYEVGARITSPASGEVTEFLRRLIPATDDENFVPAVQLTAFQARTVVSANASVRGGTPPYTFEWLSSSTDLSDKPSDASSINYTIAAGARSRERLEVIVTDANGIDVRDIVFPAPTPLAPLLEPVVAKKPPIAKTAGVRDFGVERGVADMGSGIQNGFVNGFKTEAELRFQFSGDAWENDFKQGGNGLDSQYVDNADLVLYIGHGNPGGFTFEDNHDDTSIVPGDVVGAWGNGDLEWLCLVSCQVLKWQSGGKNVIERWGGVFNRLHILLGFDTNAQDRSSFGATFAFYANGHLPGFPNLPAFPIRKAWFLAKRDAQPSDRIAAAIGPIGPNGVTNCDEYFWGQGPVGPDISKANIQGWWALYYQ